jgi:hypothetical protein
MEVSIKGHILEKLMQLLTENAEHEDPENDGRVIAMNDLWDLSSSEEHVSNFIIFDIN